jgi:hypothetical protein
MTSASDLPSMVVTRFRAVHTPGFSRSSQHMRVVACILLITAASQALADAAGEQFKCTSGASTRLVSIYRTADEGDLGSCRVEYTKDGATRTLWSASRGYAYCVKRAVELVTKLTQDNYSCAPSTVDQPGSSAERDRP